MDKSDKSQQSASQLPDEDEKHDSQESGLEQPSQAQRKQPTLADFPPPVAAPSQPVEVSSGGFTEDEVQNLRDIFDLFDKEKHGRIDIRDLEAIMTSLQRDPAEARALHGEGPVSFDQFIGLMQQVENKILNSGGHEEQKNDLAAQRALLQSGGSNPGAPNKGVISITPDSKVLDFLRLLEEYRRKCEEEGNYAEARKAASKFEELLKKEIARQRNNIRAAQEHELANIEAAQKAQFVEFSQAWDHYMSDYEATAYLSLEKLKEKHMLEFEQFQDKIRSELKARMKYSKDLLELRDKEAKLVKVKRYEEAERVKMKADLLEEFERSKLETDVHISLT